MDMSFINMTVSDFIKNIINFKTVDDILSIGKEQRDKGFIYERLWDIVIKLGFCSKFPNSKYVHKYGNTDDCSLKTLDNINTYFIIFQSFFIIIFISYYLKNNKN